MDVDYRAIARIHLTARVALHTDGQRGTRFNNEIQRKSRALGVSFERTKDLGTYLTGPWVTILTWQADRDSWKELMAHIIETCHRKHASRGENPTALPKEIVCDFQIVTIVWLESNENSIPVCFTEPEIETLNICGMKISTMQTEREL